MKEAFDNEHYLLAGVNRPTLHDRINVKAWLEQVSITQNAYFAKRRSKNGRNRFCAVK